MSQDRFILSAFDLNLWCSILENRFAVDDLEALQAIIDRDIDADPNFIGFYNIEPNELKAINQRFDVGFDPDTLAPPEIEVWLEREPKGAPYAISRISFTLASSCR
ncbi:hypothetical protein [Rhizobium leguminosarum]|uniref:hypothetical protein n=1 Tax=Rhizobium leguminosarum TaxID=384 RepID=UPI000319BDC3|nr:hypothetical protein [Rhizobium leguminosarum]